MPSLTDRPTGREYWRSLDEVADSPRFREFLHHEFPAGAAEMLDSSGRRDFLKIMAASMALAGMGTAGCRRWPRETIAPFANRPEGRVPGTPEFYATAMALGGSAIGLLATSMDGRPIKVEGNPLHPSGRGGSSAFAQASVLDLYDPDRSRTVRHRGEPGTWADFVAEMGEQFKQMRDRRGTGFYVLAEASESPTVQAMRQRLAKSMPRLTWLEYEPVNNDGELAGMQQLFGRAMRPQYDLTQARVIVSLDADFMFDHGDAINLIRDFAAGRRLAGPRAPMNRLYAFEGMLSLTGSNADHRVAVRSSAIVTVAAALAGRILDDASLRRFEEEAADVLGGMQQAIDHAVEDLQASRGQGVVIAGRRQPAIVHRLAHMINHKLGNFGKTISFTAVPNVVPHLESAVSLAKAIDAKEVQMLLLLGGNPAYDGPADLALGDKIAAVPRSVHLSHYFDETSQRCTWHVNRAHYLESWGDEAGYGGTPAVCQPQIMPLLDGRSVIELLALVADDPLSGGHELVKRTATETPGPGDPEARWRAWLHDGVVQREPWLREAPDPAPSATPLGDVARATWSATPREGMEVIFAPDYSVYDGRFANNGWLQELPDPLTKLTWDNAALIGSATARELGVESGDMVQITVGGRSMEAPVFVLPGQAEGSITLPLGYGRRFDGRVASGAGFDFYALRTSGGMGFSGGATVRRIGGHYTLASTESQFIVRPERVGGEGVQQRLPGLVRSATLEQYRDHPGFANQTEFTGVEVVHRLSMWDDQWHLREGRYAWGMSIDLSACVGCNACVVACQAENNIPIVGKEQVTRGRAMHWIRVDRYFKFGTDARGAPDVDAVQSVAMQPVPCMHCETAPCEQVCPVAATVHDEEGLNVMVYNRCVGTRYCSNNCPYKVRRFNYFDYHRRAPSREQPGAVLDVEASYYTKPQAAREPLQQLQLNPEVSVRVRGVMEKCTYCVQRIMQAKIEAKNNWVKLPDGAPEREGDRIPVADGAVRTACQQACPAEAIIFGDLADRGSRVAAAHRDSRSYQMLEEINTKPRTRYLARVTNPAFGHAATPAGQHP
jgi:molybdopterin-containing oxidoreductase family iron-sulfur binding subunit